MTLIIVDLKTIKIGFGISIFKKAYGTGYIICFFGFGRPSALFSKAHDRIVNLFIRPWLNAALFRGTNKKNVYYTGKYTAACCCKIVKFIAFIVIKILLLRALLPY